MTLEKVRYICNNNHIQFFEEEGEIIRQVTTPMTFFLKTQIYPTRICEVCGLEMETAWECS